MRTHISIPSILNSTRDVPALHAAGIVIVFFAASFLNFGWMALAFAAYASLAVHSYAGVKKTSKAQYLLQVLSFEAAVLLFGLFFQTGFHAWMPSLPSFHQGVRVFLWLLLGAVLLSTKFFLITRLYDALIIPRWFALVQKHSSGPLLAFFLLLLSLGAYFLALAGPDGTLVPQFLLQLLVPGLM